MAITDDLRKTFTDPTPLYFAAGTADLAFQQAKKVPGIVEQLRAEAPARFDAVRGTDPKDVQDKTAARAKEVQESLQVKVTELFGSLDTDLKKLGESAQDLALRGVGVAAEYAVKARETYEKVAEHGEQSVRTWRGEAAEEILDTAGVVEPAPVRTSGPVVVEDDAKPAAPAARKSGAAAKGSTAAKGGTAPKADTAKPGTAAKNGARKTTAPRKPAAKKTTPPTK